MNAEEEYRLLLARYYKAGEWFPTVSEADQKEMLPEFMQILQRLSELYGQLKAKRKTFIGIDLIG